MFKVAVASVSMRGVNVTLIEQLDPGRIVLPQVLLSTNSVALTPVMVKEALCDLVPALVKVMN